MFKVQTIFSDGALFQAAAPLTVCGTAAADSCVTGTIADAAGTVSAANTHTDSEGNFTLVLDAPVASFETYTITLHCARSGCSHVMRDVLFGEVWLAAGQSNMELPNLFHTDAQKLYETVKTMQLRVYQVEYPPYYCKEGDFPWRPDPMMPGHWIFPDQEKELSHISAAGLMFAVRLYEQLNKTAPVPVAILNANWGATFMRSWLPRSAVQADEQVLSLLRQQNMEPTPQNWNTYGLENYHQTAAMYNVKIAPLEGVKIRGLLWYQGENDTLAESQTPAYAQYLQCFHRFYARQFAADPTRFLMICSLLYPYTYGESGECRMGYFNKAITETASLWPQKFAAVPVGDLPPVWCPHLGNHPVHTTHKYALGKRMAQLALDNVYGFETDQLRPAALRTWQVRGDSIYLDFDSVGSGLFVNGPAPIGLYVAGTDGVYLPAQCSMRQNTMRVWCETIHKPCHVAYAIQSMEPGCNLWAGKYPLLPFFTDPAADIHIQARPWYDTFRTAVWSLDHWVDQPTQLFYYPTWQALPGTQLCCDNAFTLEGQSIRLCADTPEIGCFIKAHPYNELDLENFARLSLQLYSTDSLSARLTLQWDGGSLTLPLQQTGQLYGGWTRWDTQLQGIPAGVKITCMQLQFTCTGGPEYWLNLEKLRLWKS